MRGVRGRSSPLPTFPSPSSDGIVVNGCKRQWPGSPRLSASLRVRFWPTRRSVGVRENRKTPEPKPAATAGRAGICGAAVVRVTRNGTERARVQM